MHRIDSNGSVTTRPAIAPAGTAGWWRMKDAGAGVDGTVAHADWFNDVQANLFHLLTLAGITPTKGPGGDTNLHDALAALFAPTGYIRGLEVVNNATFPQTRVDISPGVARVASEDRIARLAAAITKRLDVDWAEGNGNGGFPSGLTLANNTWYGVFVLLKDDGTVDGGFDTSLTAANLLSDAGASYTRYRRVGFVRTNGSAQMEQFRQHGNVVMWNAPFIDVDLTDPGTAEITHTLGHVPTGVRIEALLSMRLNISVSCFFSYVSGNGGISAAPDDTTASAERTSGGGDAVYMSAHILTSTTQQVKTRQSASNGTTHLRIKVYGYIDPR